MRNFLAFISPLFLAETTGKKISYGHFVEKMQTVLLEICTNFHFCSVISLLMHFCFFQFSIIGLFILSVVRSIGVPLVEHFSYGYFDKVEFLSLALVAESLVRRFAEAFRKVTYEILVGLSDNDRMGYEKNRVVWFITSMAFVLCGVPELCSEIYSISIAPVSIWCIICILLQ